MSIKVHKKTTIYSFKTHSQEENIKMLKLTLPFLMHNPVLIHTLETLKTPL